MQLVNGVEMKENTINYKGIRTNNLKNIDVSIKKGTLIGIAGPSGSGKSSLAYGTIHSISEFEWNKISNENISSYDFKIDEYTNVIPSISLKQDNTNSNPRSTIATFLHIDKIFRLIFSTTNNVSPSLFSFNNPRNCCPKCAGLGYINIFDESLLIDWEKSISKKPFKIWNNSYQQKLLEKYAILMGIPLDVKIKDLPSEYLNKLLYSHLYEPISISYKLNGKSRTRKFRFVGLMEEINQLANDKKHISSYQKIANYSRITDCDTCNGSRFSDDILKYKYNGKSIGELYLMEISDLCSFLTESIKKEQKTEIKKMLDSIYIILSGFISAKLEYLNLNRSIPSLSGGELQRIRLLNILNSQIDDMMYIVDEPSASLHISEYESIITDLFHLKERGNTILMVEHNSYFLERTDENIFMGYSSGENGGYIIPKPSFETLYSFTPRKCDSFFQINNINQHNVKNINVKIPKNRIIGIYGPSGSGKSTIAKNINNKIPNGEYVTQKPLRGSNSSIIASYSGIFDAIRQLFAEYNHKTPEIFSFYNEEGQCPNCKGRGKITHEIDFGRTKIDVICDACNGKRFSETTLLYKFKDFSIFDIMNFTIDTLIEKQLFDENTIITKQLNNLRRLGLGHLTLFRTTDTLSGGESQRLKLIKFIGKKLKDKIFLFDEPLKGLSNQNVYLLMKIFKDITDEGGTVVFIEHNPIAILFCDYIIEVGPGKGKNGGKILFDGDVNSFKETDRWKPYEKVLPYSEK